MLRQLFSRCVRGFHQPSLLRAFEGGLVAICVATVCQQLVLLMGTSLAVSIGVMTALAGGIAIGFARHAQASALDRAIRHLALTAWMVGTPWWLQLTDALIRRPGLIDPSQGWRAESVVVAICLFLVGIPALLCTRLATRYASESPSEQPQWILFGAAFGLTVWGFGLAQVVGPWFCGVAAATIGLALAVWRLMYEQDSVRTEALGSPETPHRTTTPGTYLSSGGRAWHTICDGLLAVGSGGLLAASTRVLEQLLPGTVYLVCAEVIGLVLGLGCGCAFAMSRIGRRIPANRGRLSACIGLALLGVLIPITFPELVHLELWFNATISSTTLLLLARGLTAVALSAPVGAVMAFVVANRDESTVAGAASTKIRLWLLSGVSGFCLVAYAGQWGITPENACVGCAWWIVVVAVVQVGIRPVLWTGRLGRCAIAAALVVVAVAPHWRHRLDPRLSARLLFNTSVFVGYRAGYSAALLPSVDEGRNVATVAGARGIWTVWKYGGRQLQVRENGMPGGVVSCDARVFPRFLPETLQAALPMILHDKPQSLLLLGLGSGESLLTGMSFPLPEIVCWEPDATRIRVVGEMLASHADVNPLEDERVRVNTADPVLALDAETGLFDAIVSSPDHVALLRAQSCFTQSFYRRVARRLSPQGVFCQRLPCVDIGPRPLQAIVRTVQSVFRDVMAIEAAPGELLLTATNSPDGLLQPKLTDRLQLPHVRTLLAESGIDWTVILNLTAYTNSGLQEFAAQGARRPNLVENSRLTFSMPRDVMRWAPKLQEVHTALAPHAGRLLNWIGEEGASPVLLRRLSEVAGQHALMANYADQYWSYRATLRTHLTEKPRTKIQQTSASTEPKEELHPEDRRRLRYFTTLGRATKTRMPHDIEALERFEQPYDPLLSYFIHLEAAELYAQSPQRNVREELRHRLYAIWFSSPRDASLRNVVAALALLRDSADAEPDPVRRWDLLNALLQALQQRWDARIGVTPTKVKDIIEDIDLTVLAAEKTFDAMVAVTRDAGLPNDLWLARRSALEKTLIRPVKAYRSEMLPHLHRDAARKNAAEQMVIDDDVNESSASPAVHAVAEQPETGAPSTSTEE